MNNMEFPEFLKSISINYLDYTNQLKNLVIDFNNPNNKEDLKTDFTDSFVSIVIPIYKGNFVEEALDSIFRINYKNFELCLCIDGNEVSKLKILKYFSFKENLENYYEFLYKNIKVKVRAKKENEGIGKTFNDCILMAKGEFIIRIDEDNEFLPQILEKLLEEYTIRYRCGKRNFIIYCNSYVKIIDKNIIIKSESQTKHKRNIFENQKQEILKGCWALIQGRLVSREIYKNVGLYSNLLKFNEDLEWDTRAIWINNVFFEYLNQELVLMKEHKNRESHRLSDEQIFNQGNFSRQMVFDMMEAMKENKQINKHFSELP